MTLERDPVAIGQLAVEQLSEGVVVRALRVYGL